MSRAEELINCRVCGQSISSKVKTCPHCGAKKPQPKQKINAKAGCFTTIVLLLGLVIIIALPSKNNKQKEKTQTVYEMFQITEDKYNEFLPVFAKCGLSEIKKVEKEDTDNKGNTAYYIEVEGIIGSEGSYNGSKDGNIIYVYLDKNQNLNEILVNFLPVYRNGEVLATAKAFTTITIEEKTECQLQCEKIAKEILKSPSTAKFCSYTDYIFSRENGIVTAQGYVDAQNSFGAIIRSKYQIQIDFVNRKIISFIFDDKKVL